ncbi:leucine rich repeat [Cystoisospora suis]|uniref:Leucine rich repeat n=1 Tax=Cystoisospora suis TaxID=483139 RepID=A0A2C6L628_9APIC|nr:leucine rich repeat [Cystoisospora suis]
MASSQEGGPRSTGSMEASGIGLGPVLTGEKLAGLILAAVPKKMKGCQHLDISRNDIRKICVSLGEIVGLGLETVEHLVLRGNLLRQLDGRVLTFPHVHVLDVSGNLISQILHFEGQFELQKLYLRGNRLTDINGLADSPLQHTLEVLDVSENNISDLRGLATLSVMENLRALNVLGNPIETHPLVGNVVLEGFCMLCCPLLEVLNNRRITPEIRDAVICWSSDEPQGRAVSACVNRFRQYFERQCGKKDLVLDPLPTSTGTEGNAALTRGKTGLYSVATSRGTAAGKSRMSPSPGLGPSESQPGRSGVLHSNPTRLTVAGRASSNRTTSGRPSQNAANCLVFARSSPDPRDGFRVVDMVSSPLERDEHCDRPGRRSVHPAQHSPVASEGRFSRPAHSTLDGGLPKGVDRHPGTTSYSTRCRLYPRATSGRTKDCLEQERRVYMGHRSATVTKATQTPDWWNEPEVVYVVRSPRDGQPAQTAQGRDEYRDKRHTHRTSKVGYSSALPRAVGDFQFVIRADDVGALIPAKDLLALRRRESLRGGTEDTEHAEDSGGLGESSFIRQEEYERAPSGVNEEEWMENDDAEQDTQEQSAEYEEQGWTTEAISHQGSWGEYDEEQGYERAEEDRHPVGDDTDTPQQLQVQVTDVTDLDPDNDEGAGVVAQDDGGETGESGT